MNIKRREFLEKSSKITLGIGAGLAAQAIKAERIHTEAALFSSKS